MHLNSQHLPGRRRFLGYGSGPRPPYRIGDKEVSIFKKGGDIAPHIFATKSRANVYFRRSCLYLFAGGETPAWAGQKKETGQTNETISLFNAGYFLFSLIHAEYPILGGVYSVRGERRDSATARSHFVSWSTGLSARSTRRTLSNPSSCYIVRSCRERRFNNFSVGAAPFRESEKSDSQSAATTTGILLS